VVVTLGLTARVAGLALTPVCATPSDQVTFQGPVPLSAAEIVAELPLHNGPVPLTTELGRGFTVTTALPVRSAASPLHLESARAVIV
jgi:hypothetical protein